MNTAKINLFFGSKQCPTPPEWGEKPFWNQVHGIKCVEVVKAAQNCGDADSLWTQLPNFRIGVRAADCVPILLAFEEHGAVMAVGAIHAGWRGTLGRVIEHFFNALPEKFSNTERWSAWMGPSIRACCYEVSPELIEQFSTEFPEISQQYIEPKVRHLDLIAINEAELKRLGVGKIQIHQDCTFCSEKYFSYRRGDRNARQHSIISF